VIIILLVYMFIFVTVLQPVGGQQSICALLENLSNHTNVTHQGQKDMIHYILRVHISADICLMLFL